MVTVSEQRRAVLEAGSLEELAQHLERCSDAAQADVASAGDERVRQFARGRVVAWERAAHLLRWALAAHPQNEEPAAPITVEDADAVIPAGSGVITDKPANPHDDTAGIERMNAATAHQRCNDLARRVHALEAHSAPETAATAKYATEPQKSLQGAATLDGEALTQETGHDALTEDADETVTECLREMLSHAREQTERALENTILTALTLGIMRHRGEGDAVTFQEAIDNAQAAGERAAAIRAAREAGTDADKQG